MKCGPLTFQCACLVCVCRSMQSASRALSNSTALTRIDSDRSFFVLNMARLLSHNTLSRMTDGDGLGLQEGQQVGVDHLGVCRAHSVRELLVDFQAGLLE